MKKKSPSHFLLISEDIRPEINGKFSVMGVVNKRIDLQKEEGEAYCHHTLAAYGEFELKTAPKAVFISITDPDGEVITEGMIPVPEKNNKKMVLAGKFVNAKFSKSGIYTFSVKIDEDEYTKDFSIQVE